nr:acetoacetate decarboxylase family protein [Acinetobacter cumulans]
MRKKMQIPAITTEVIQSPPPWKLQGAGFILNYWVTPRFIQQSAILHHSPSPIGRMIQVMLVRYESSPVGAYDELLILDHPLISKRVLSSIPKIYVSTLASVTHGQTLWGIPKELAQFEWRDTKLGLTCTVRVAGQHFTLTLYKAKKPKLFYINSHHIPSSILQIRQTWQNKRYSFAPQFRGHIAKLAGVKWSDSQGLFPDFSQARLLQSFFVPKFSLLFPEAKIKDR